jgi:hypothetical protein
MLASLESVGVALFAAALHGSFQCLVVIPDTYVHLIGSDELQPASVS